MRRAFAFIALLWLFALLLFLVHPAGAAPRLDTLSVQPSNGVDTSLVSATATTNYGTDPNLFIGRNSGSGSTRRALIYFDLSSIPSNATITNATLSLWVKQDLAGANLTIGAFRSERAWDEATATWNIYSTGNNWTNPGGWHVGDFDPTVWGSVVVTDGSAVGTQVDLSLSTSEFTKFINGTYTNLGWFLIGDDEVTDAFNFYSSDEVTETGRRPRLVVNYTVPTATPTATGTVPPTSTPTLTATVVPGTTPTFTPELDYEPGSPDFEFWWRWITGIIFIASGMFYQGVFWFFILPYLFAYGELQGQMVAFTFIFLYGVGLYQNLIKAKDV